ncbi:membrane protein [Mycolicibacter terrae]|uniref:Membrane protein n=3 Tax=Mycolicibacter terrae TaxID=1788 RepID=A0AAD1HSX3_9MYCO|nr:membrane protein [Mycolicibacter terrae]
MTALLILAIAASSALVFTSRVELLKLAVIVALWAAVAAAFVSVIYRRQSDVDQARARDLKLVYDLQLDREISARREYELTVESQLRRELASELRAQAADEVAALRAELAALRTNLEILFDADLSQRAALETDSSARTTVRAYSDWARSGGDSGAARATPAAATFYPEDSVSQTAENPIIDVPEVRIPTGGIPMPQTSQTSQSSQTPQAQHAPQAPQPPQPSAETTYRGSHRRSADEASRRAADEAPRRAADEAPRRAADEIQQPAGRWTPPPQPFVPPEARREPEPPPPPPPAPQQPWVAPPPASAPTWKPVGAEGEWRPPAAPGSNWSAETPGDSGRHGAAESQHFGDHAAVAPERGAEAPSRHGRHAGPGAVADGPVNGAETAPHDGEGRRRARSRHSVDSAPHPAQPAHPEPASAAAGTARHSAGAEPGTEAAPNTGGQSVAELLARLQATPTVGRRRRRREE